MSVWFGRRGHGGDHGGHDDGGSRGRAGRFRGATRVAHKSMLPESPTLIRLTAADVQLRRGLQGELRLLLPEVCYRRVTLRRPFPLMHAGEWVSVCAADGPEIGLLPSLDGLDPESRQLAEEELHLRYFIPRVHAITDLRDELQGGRSGGVVWDLDTDRGPARLHMPNTNEYIQVLEAGRLLLTDRAGNRYEIADVGRLDTASRRRLSRYVWL